MDEPRVLGLRATGGRNDVRVVIMGCGRVGSSLAMAMQKRGHDVAIIDRDPSAFVRLSPDFTGVTIAGVGFDRDVLERAGIENADAFAAVSSGDNSNIISARVARETFDVERVVARIYDAKRAEVYERLGIPTVATVPWTTDTNFVMASPCRPRTAPREVSVRLSCCHGPACSPASAMAEARKNSRTPTRA